MELKNVIPTLEYSLPRVIETTSAVEKIEDWSKVRSPARAKRRMKNGHRQNVKVYHKPTCYLDKKEDTRFMHFEVVKRMREKLEDRIGRMREKSYLNLLQR